MKILYVSQYFPPEMGAPAGRVSELSRHWASFGHQVTVLTGFPNHPTGEVLPEYKARFRRLIYREWIDGIQVVRVWLAPFPNRKSYERILNYTSFCLSSCIIGTFFRRYDIIIATSPQLLVGLTGLWIGWLKRTPWILEVRDLWPDSITASGVGNKRSILATSLRALSGLLYRACNHIVVVTPAFKEELVSKWKISPEKISVVENGVETNFFMEVRDINRAKNAAGLKGRFVVSYIGTLGLAHGLSTVLEAAAQLQKNFPTILFQFVGEGADKERLIKFAQDLGLNNILFRPQKPREKIPAVIKASDICLVMLKKAEVFKTVIPTKMLEFMACARPVILGVDGQARKVLDMAGAGVFTMPEDPVALSNAIIQLYQNAGLRKTLGRNGRQYILKHLTRETTANTYIRVLKKAISNWKP